MAALWVFDKICMESEICVAWGYLGTLIAFLSEDSAHLRPRKDCNGIKYLDIAALSISELVMSGTVFLHSCDPAPRVFDKMKARKCAMTMFPDEMNLRTEKEAG